MHEQIWRIGNLTNADAEWYCLAAETAAHLHWGETLPPIVQQRLDDARAAAQEVREWLEEVSVMLAIEGVEEVSGPPLVEMEGEVTDDEDDEDESWMS